MKKWRFVPRFTISWNFVVGLFSLSLVFVFTMQRNLELVAHRNRKIEETKERKNGHDVGTSLLSVLHAID